MHALTPRQKTARSFFALGHPRRLKIVEILADYPRGTTYEALGTATGIPPASLTHHLRFLKDAHLVHRKISGPYSIYTLDQTQLNQALQSPVPKLKRAA